MKERQEETRARGAACIVKVKIMCLLTKKWSVRDSNPDSYI